jgi:predicted pyridoxine 5'-phosphate oxidase superfamily flavin-nucleotide-binding protein
VSLQRLVGSAEHLGLHGHRIFRDTLSDQHRNFYPRLPFAVLGAVDAERNVWATLRAGIPGFLTSNEPSSLHVATPRDAADPAESGLNDGDAIALLGIELHTRRRNRLNGTVRRSSDDSLDIVVGQSYGNCPQYIQLRDYEWNRDPKTPSTVAPEALPRLNARAREMIATADTFFVASYIDLDSGVRQADVSHRGGRPGFVRVDAADTLTIPDFAGNQFFNTLGNFMVNPRAGLVFVDFERGDLLQLTGTAQVVLDDPEVATFRGAERLWRFTPGRSVYRADALPLRWTFERNGWSPESLRTGNWPQRPG